MTVSYFERLGGAAVVKQAISRFYDLVLADEELRPYFAKADLGQLKAHQTALLARVLRGPGQHVPPDLASAHRDLGITDEQYARVAHYLLTALRAHGATQEIVEGVELTLTAARHTIVRHDPLPLGGREEGWS
ncbi:hemoglobin [Micromonospora pattaloongensis]|uniref:Hemoglobin n=1 Tax=Micromonospora pattaloongensis TaxID=405436 RepID=A0A1H3FKP2_9ACTN|nr:group 1 truncated hemoglobin [Micromonospora pattaloongensis]SDX90689.1 hemoglobin [Micromonospora pattaloongensis]